MTVKPYDPERPKKTQVRDMFDRIAPRYDLLNHTLSFNIDRLWRRRVVRLVRRSGAQRILDLAPGACDLAIALALHGPGARVLGVDLSEGMLDIARRKVAVRGLDARIRLEQGDAEHLGAADASVDALTVAFGVRNFGDLEAGLREMARTIRPGGKVVIVEFSEPKGALCGPLSRFYSGGRLPRVGGAVSKDRKAYEYRPASVEAFPEPGAFMELMRRAGFRNCRARSQSFGIAQIYTGER